MRTKRFIEALSKKTSFNSSALEKVLVLKEILHDFSTTEELKNLWVLKGGTALNLLYFNAPRLSVDIDINFIGAESVEELRDARPIFEQRVQGIFERLRLTTRRAPVEHGGGKYFLRYESVF